LYSFQTVKLVTKEICYRVTFWDWNPLQNSWLRNIVNTKVKIAFKHKYHISNRFTFAIADIVIVNRKNHRRHIQNHIWQFSHISNNCWMRSLGYEKPRICKNLLRLWAKLELQANLEELSLGWSACIEIVLFIRVNISPKKRFWWLEGPIEF